MALASWTDLVKEHPGDMKKLKRSAVIRADAVLTGSYVDTDEVDTEKGAGITFYFKITRGSLSSIDFIIWSSPDGGTTWYREGAEAVGLLQIDIGSPYYRLDPLTDNKYVHALAPGNRMKLQVQGNGSVSGSSLQITVVGVY